MNKTLVVNILLCKAYKYTNLYPNTATS